MNNKTDPDPLRKYFSAVWWANQMMALTLQLIAATARAATATCLVALGLIARLVRIFLRNR